MMKLYVLYGGDIICRDISMLNSGLEVNGEKELANPVFLIRHPKGDLVWDSGLPDELLGKPEGVEAWIFHLSMKKTLLSQFKKIGVNPAEIDYFAFSHVHNDHTGNARYFKSSTLIMQEKEYEAAFHAEKEPYNYNDYRELKNAAVMKLRGDHDLFGDGRIRFISTPGHTPGHQSLLLELDETGPVIISGDISYYQENLDQKGVPGFNYSHEESLKSVDKILALQDKLHAQLWIQHDADRFRILKHAPLYYK